MRKNFYLIFSAIIALVVSISIFVIIGLFYKKQDDSPTTEGILTDISAEFICEEELFEGTELEDLRQYLTVEAIYDNTLASTVTDYDLLGTLIAGDCIVTVTYRTKTTSFIVTIKVAMIPVETPETEDIWGEYICSFYESQTVYLNLYEDYSYVLSEGFEQLATGSFDIINDNNIRMEYGENRVYLSLDNKNGIAELTDLTVGRSKIATYTFLESGVGAVDAEYTLFLYRDFYYRIDKRYVNKLSYELSLFGTYSYLDNNILRLTYLDTHSDIVLSSSDTSYLPIELAYELRIIGEFVMTESDEFCDTEYILTLLPEQSYKLTVTNYIQGNYLSGAVERGVYRREGDKIVISYWDNTKIILGETDSFSLCYIYSYQSFKSQIIYQLKIFYDGGSEYGFALDALSEQNLDFSNEQGHFEKVDLSGTILLNCDSGEDIAVNILDKNNFLLINDFAGRYLCEDADIAYELNIAWDGSYTLYIGGISSNGVCEFSYGYIKLSDTLFVELKHDATFDLIGNLGIEMTCNIPTIFVQSATLNLENVTLNISTLYGDSLSVPVLREYVTNFSTEEEGVFLGTITYNSWQYRFQYTITAQEVPSHIKVYNLPKNTFINNELNIDLLYLEVISNFGNVTVIDSVSSEWIQNFNTSASGDYTMIVTYSGMNYYHNYTVLLQTEAVSISVGSITAEYNIGDEFIFDNAYINVLYNNGHIASIAISSDMLSDFSTDNEGVLLGTVTYLNLKCYFEYTVHKLVPLNTVLLGESVTVYTTNNAEYAYMPKFAFAPEDDGLYLFRTIGEIDTFGYLYDEDGTLIRTNDDYGLDLNFGIAYPMKAGSVYIIAARLLITPMGFFDFSIQRVGDYSISDSETAGTYRNSDDSDIEEITLNLDYSFTATRSLQDEYTGYYYAVNNNTHYKLIGNFSDRSYLIIELNETNLTFTVTDTITD